ncbi:chemotaxis protein CheW [Pseudomarimonas arenosa]|uniref:Chemotaxis protein CheW n=1 Tax=Pseudomarimonas arenosa TaxID=2774145 RepID=A0AAW3ZK29_9GAMM|nr:chemotaxis protein CheW [Pseudomarimonas arenosa]MBD8525564.1 chemotaxis protein CheW [Pseudomarimonas arenosa]
MEKKVADIRGVMITVTNGRLLLPNATVAEVITFSEPEVVPDAPAWLLGRLRWRGWRIPLISFSRLAGFAEKETESGAKVAVFKALSGNPKLPYFCMVTQGFPRLTTVPAAELLDAPTDEALPTGARMRVMLRDDQAYVPDLEGIEGRLAEVLGSA